MEAFIPSRRAEDVPPYLHRARTRQAGAWRSQALLTNREGFADLAGRDAVFFDGGFEALQRLFDRFAANREGSMVDAEKFLDAGVIRHLHRLLRGAMATAAAAVRPDGHDAEVDRAFADFFE